MKIAFFGTPHFTTLFLDFLKDEGFLPDLIVTGKDTKQGRNMRISSPEPKKWAEKHAISCLQPEKIDQSFIDKLKNTQYDLFIVVAYGKILPEELINMPMYGTINVHYSLLPKYRGATPIESAILHGETKTGVSIQHMVYQLDAGPIIEQKEIPIHENDTHIDIRNILNQEALILLKNSIRRLVHGENKFTLQDESQKTHCSKIKKEDGLVDFSKDTDTLIWRKYRAYSGWPGIFFYAEKNGKKLRIKIDKAHIDNGTVIIDTVIPEGRKVMNYKDYQNWK